MFDKLFHIVVAVASNCDDDAAAIIAADEALFAAVYAAFETLYAVNALLFSVKALLYASVNEPFTPVSVVNLVIVALVVSIELCIPAAAVATLLFEL